MLGSMKTNLNHVIPRSIQIELLPSVTVAPELVGVVHEVVREEDDTDADYAARCELFALISEAAGKH
jgi:hypothetical protein